jgi:hypothetical protein
MSFERHPLQNGAAALPVLEVTERKRSFIPHRLRLPLNSALAENGFDSCLNVD